MPTELPCGCKIDPSDTEDGDEYEDEEPEPGWKRLWKENNKHFVPTRASISAEKAFKKFDRIVLVGEAGCGKSAIARHIALKYESEGLKIIQVNNLKSIKNSPVRKKSVVFIVEDPIGRGFLDEKAFRSWHHQQKLFNKYFKTDKHGKRQVKTPKVIVTCRSDLINCERSTFKNYEMIDLDNEIRKLTKDEKEQILKIHVDCSKISDIDVETVVNTNQAFPSITRMASTCVSFKADMIQFYKDPLNAIKKQIQILREKSKERYLCLLLLVLHGNQLSVCSFDDYEDEDKTGNVMQKETDVGIGDECNSTSSEYNDESEASDDNESYDGDCSDNEELDGIDKNLLSDLMETIGISSSTSRKTLLKYMWSIRGHYFVKHIERSSKTVPFWKQEEDKVFKITNDAFLHILTVVFCEDIPDKFMKYCKSAFFRMMTTSSNRTKCIWSNVSLEERYIDVFLDRFENDVKNRVFLDVFLCPWFKDEKVQKSLQKRLKSKSYMEVIKLVVMTKLNNVVELETFPTVIQKKVRGFGRLDLMSMCKEVSPIVLSLMLNIDDCFQTMFTLVKNGIDGTKYLNKAPLMSACCVNGREDFARMILESGGKAQECLDECENIYSVHIAANFLQSNILSIIVDSVDDINLTTRRNQSPLFLAVAAGNYVLHCIRSNGGDVSSNVDDARLKSICILVDKRANINSHPGVFQSPLSISCTKNMKIAEILLQNNADVNEIGHGKKSPLHQAAKSGNLKLLQLLLDKGADVNVRSVYGFTPLYYATLNGHEGVVEILLSKGAARELKEETGFSPFFVACKHGHLSLVKMFSQHSPFMNVISPTGTSALMIAVDNGHSEVVEFLLSNDADVNIIRHHDKVSPLYLAASYGYNFIVELLLKHGSAVDFKAKGRRTPLIVASQNGHSSVVEILLNNSAKINFACNNKKTPLIYAAENGHLGVAQLLLKRNADVNHCTKKGFNALMQASSRGHNDVVSELLKHQANVNQQTAGGETPLYFASKNGYTGIVTELLANKADFQVAKKDGSTPLYIACNNGHVNTVKELLIHDKNVDGGESLHPLNAASYKGYERIVQVLIENGADMNLKDDDGCTPLIDASKNGWTETVKVLLDNGAQTNIYSDEGEDGIEMNALHHASEKGHTDIVKLLVEHGMDINAHTEYTETPIQLALFNNRPGTSSFLLERGADLSIVLANGEPALYYACRAGLSAIVDALLKCGAEINPKTGLVPLLGAIEEGHDDIVRVLLDHGADPNYPAESTIDCTTLLLNAVKRQHCSIVQQLLEHGAHVNTPNPKLLTPLHADASFCYETDVMSLLLKHNATVNALTDFNLTPLMVMLSEKTASKNRMELLISYGADLNMCDARQWTVLHYAAGHNCGLASILLEHGANPNVQDKEGDSALHITGYAGSLAVAKALINFGADLNIRNKSGLTPLDIAIQYNRHKIANIITQKLNELKNNCATALEGEIVLVKRHPSEPVLPRRRNRSKLNKTWR